MIKIIFAHNDSHDYIIINHYNFITILYITMVMIATISTHNHGDYYNNIFTGNHAWLMITTSLCIMYLITVGYSSLVQR